MEDLATRLATKHMIKFDISCCAAPMSDAPFRALCMRYGSTCAYTEMLYAHKVIEREDQLVAGDSLGPVDYLDAYLPAADHSAYSNPVRGHTYRTGPLVAQICGNSPQILARACIKIALTGRCQAIDLNLGCPQQRAQENLFGSYLLDKEHWPNVFACVHAMHTALELYCIPVFCKIRFCPGGHEGTESYFQLTTEFCEGLFSSGCALVTIHGRTRGSPKVRRAGPADLSLVQRIAAELRRRGYSQPVLANGIIITRRDTANNRLEAPAVGGVMSAEGLLVDPCVFIESRNARGEAENTEEKLERYCPSRREIFREYCDLSNAFAEAGGWSLLDAYCRATANHADVEITESKQIVIARQHLSWMLRKVGGGRCVKFSYLGDFRRHTDLLNALSNSKSLEDLIVIAERCLGGVQAEPAYQDRLWQ